MARAAVKLSRNISPYLPVLARRIKDSAYNKDPEQLAFNRNKVVVVIYPQEILLTHLENEAAARSTLDWLKNIFDQAEKS
jgi:ArsR family metal-binding transcriptional regulator